MKTTQELLKEWAVVASQAKAAKEREASLRLALCTLLFPNPVEGTNTLKFEDGCVVKGTAKVNRTLDPAVVPAVIAALHAKGVDTREIFSYEPKLKLKGYKALYPDMLLIADECVESKPGAMALEVTFAAEIHND